MSGWILILIIFCEEEDGIDDLEFCKGDVWCV